MNDPASDPLAYVQPGTPGPLPASPCCGATVGVPDVFEFGCTRSPHHPGQHIAVAEDLSVAATWTDSVLSIDLSEAGHQ